MSVQGDASETAADATALGHRGPPTAGRRILAGLFWLLACLGVLVASLTVWAHQTLLTTNGWTGLVTTMAADPEVVAGSSRIVTHRVSEAVGLEDRIAELLPGPASLLAGPITTRVEDATASALATAMGTDAFQSLWASANARGHAAAMQVIRGGNEVVSAEEGAITLNVVPLVEATLDRLRSSGFLPADVQLPDVTESTAQEAVTRLEVALGVELPDDIGTITLIGSERLATVQQAVRAFDLLTIALVLVAVVFVALALYLSGRRLRMLLWLALGSVVAILLARSVARAILADLSGALADGPAGQTIRGVTNVVVDSVMWFTFAVIAVALVIAAVAWWAARRDARAAAPAPGEPAPEAVPVTVAARGWARRNSGSLLAGGLGVIGLVALWRAVGADVALIAAALALLWVMVVRFVSSPEEEAPLAPPAGEGPPA